MTQGRKLADSLRKNLGIGTRSRRYRKGADLHSEMIEALRNATVYPGYYTGERHALFAAAWGVFLNWDKHVNGHRIDPTLSRKIAEMSPYRLASLLGEMLDAGVTNAGEGERFFQNLR
jgi:hypothetical protein